MWIGRATVATVITTLSLLLVTPASAAPLQLWANSVSPLTANEGEESRARAYGDWQISATDGGTRSVAGGKVFDPQNGAERGDYFRLETWVNAGYCLEPDYTSCSSQYYFLGSGESKRHFVAKWSDPLLVSTGLSATASYARAAMQACEDRQFRPDPCSGQLFTRGNDY